MNKIVQMDNCDTDQNLIDEESKISLKNKGILFA